MKIKLTSNELSSLRACSVKSCKCDIAEQKKFVSKMSKIIKSQDGDTVIYPQNEMDCELLSRKLSVNNLSNSDL